jgi:glycosyltransferase involved in cell wall biosynthesis
MLLGTMEKHVNIYIFLNQAVRPLYIDILNSFAEHNRKVVLFTGDIRIGSVPLRPEVITKVKFPYKSDTLFIRLVTFFLYSAFTFLSLFRHLRKTNELVITTTPPFLPYFGLFFKKFFRLQYHLVIYDLYPDVLVSLKLIRKNGFVDRIFKSLNKSLYANATSIITISDIMAQAARRYCSESKKIHVIPNWVDNEFIKPIPKKNNRFAIKYQQNTKLTVLYSGNLGSTHDFDTLLEAIRELRSRTDISFVIIGEGIKRKLIESYKIKYKLDNLLMLPLQSKDELPFTLACADIGVITLDQDASHVSVPSKTYYMMAAGSAILALGSDDSELSDLVRKFNIGKNFTKGKVKELVEFILELNANKDELLKYKTNSRNASELFTPKNAEEYYKIITR